MSMTIEEAMAIAVLKGDKAAAYMLADRLLEQFHGGGQLEEGLRLVRRENQANHLAQTFRVYHWPEFRAFAERLGIAWSALTTGLTINMPADELVEIIHHYQGEDTQTAQATTDQEGNS